MVRHEGGCGPDAQRERLRHACAIVAVVVFAVALLLSVPGVGKGAPPNGSNTYIGRIWEAVASGDAVEDAIEEVGLMRLTKDASPSWLEEEVLPVGFMKGAISNAGSDVIYFARDGDAGEVMEEVGSLLAAKGWRECLDGSEDLDDGMNTRTFAKGGGVCTWIMVECAQAGGEASVVLRIRHT